MRTVPCLLVAAIVATLAGACGGKTLGDGQGTGSGSGSSTTTSSSTSSGSSRTSGTTPPATCVDFEPTPAELQCSADSDCVSLNAGNICPGDCFCGGSPGNQTAQAREEAATAGFPEEACGCPEFGQPKCFEGQCILCNFEEDAGPGCNDDGGTLSFEGGSDAGVCAPVDLADYSTSCQQASDCILIQTGEVCSGSCNCGGSPVNASEQAKYNQATMGITFDECPCASLPLACIGGQCAVCGDFVPCGGDAG